jgi:hypothetical protein
MAMPSPAGAPSAAASQEQLQADQRQKRAVLIAALFAGLGVSTLLLVLLTGR